MTSEKYYYAARTKRDIKNNRGFYISKVRFDKPEDAVFAMNAFYPRGVVRFWAVFKGADLKKYSGGPLEAFLLKMNITIYKGEPRWPIPTTSPNTLQASLQLKKRDTKNS